MSINYRFLLAATLVCLGIGSCKKDFLDVDETQNLYRQTYVKDLTTMQEFMYGNYTLVAQYMEYATVTAYPEIVADNMRPVAADNAALMTAHYNWTQVSDGTDYQATVASSPSAQGMDPLWLLGYRTIRACNFVIEDVGKYQNENRAKADALRGQAYAVRALVYFKLVNVFGQHYTFTPGATHPGVPYITSSDITKPYSRQTVGEVYAAMISDLQTAIELLPADLTDTRVMSRIAARALLARIYLFKEDFANAKVVAMEVAAQVPLMTITGGYPDAMFRFRSPNQTESLFQLVPGALGNGGATGYSTTFLGRFVRRAPLRFVATNDVASIIIENPNDVRRFWVKDTVAFGGPQKLIKKYPSGVAPEPSPAIPIPESAYYVPLLRTSEMFLTVAEAAAKSGDENTARVYINAIRQRADPTIADLSTTGPALLDSIYKERRKELSFEGFRMFDMQRWKMSVHRIDVLAGYKTDLPYPNDKAIAPIPMTEVKLSGIPQNPSY
jgi:starch-binding outer membrane protein, SusD/RagB family